MKFKLEIVTPERLIYSDDIDLITVPTVQGDISILARHVPLISILEPGEIKIKKDGDVSFLAIAGGFIQVTGQKVTILADAAERAEEIDLSRAEEARERARNLMQQKQLDKLSHAEAMASLQCALTRIKVARRKGKKTD